MKNPVLFSLILIFILSCDKKSEKDTTTSTQEWVSLFNGENLDGWTMKVAGFPVGENFGNTFRVEDGILKIRYDQYDSFDGKFGALYTETKYMNYRLKAEYRFVGETAPGAPEWGYRDSGVQYHCQSPSSLKMDQAFPVCLEYNLHGGNGTDERPVGEACASGTIIRFEGKDNTAYNTPATVKRTFHGDQWVTLEIDVQSDTIRHFVNGEEILLFTNPRYDLDHEFGQSLIVDGEEKVIDGYISLQSNSHPIDFRKIEILEYN